MLPQTISISFFTVNTFTFLMGLGILISISLSALTYRLYDACGIGTLVDVCLAGLILGMIAGRIGHVLIHWAYFSEHTGEIIQMNAGGLNWHSALTGGLLGAWLMKTIVYRQVNFHFMLESWAIAIPLLGFMGWWACGAFFCGYGAEINNLTDYPATLVWEAPALNGMVAPRFATQPLGMMWAVMVLLVIVICIWRGWLANKRFGASLMLWSVGMILLGYLRGDAMPLWSGLRLDQWLDAFMLILGGAYAFWHR
jgi:phosphatidylglycerol:prolipoprotein diacylglycerol transferase